MRTELAALRSVPAFRRAIAVAIALAGMLVISFLGVKNLRANTIEDARSALSNGGVAGLVALVYAAASAGGEVGRGGLALALLGGAHHAPHGRSRPAARLRRRRRLARRRRRRHGRDPHVRAARPERRAPAGRGRRRGPRHAGRSSTPR